LYDSFVHLVVLRKTPIGALSDLDGLRVSVGEVNSGTEFTVTQIIEKTGLQMEEVRLDQATSAEALAQGSIDAMFSLTGLPTPAIADLAEAREIRLIDLADTAEVMTDVSPDAYFPASIPATTYHGVPARPTFSVPNLLLCGGGLSDDFVHTVIDTVHRGAPRLASRRPEAAQINVRTGISTGIMPLHPGAAEWYREHKPARGARFRARSTATRRPRRTRDARHRPSRPRGRVAPRPHATDRRRSPNPDRCPRCSGAAGNARNGSWPTPADPPASRSRCREPIVRRGHRTRHAPPPEYPRTDAGRC